MCSWNGPAGWNLFVPNPDLFFALANTLSGMEIVAARNGVNLAKNSAGGDDRDRMSIFRLGFAAVEIQFSSDKLPAPFV